MTGSYKSVKEIRDNGAIIRVHIPDLTEKERAKRIEKMQRAATKLFK